MSPLTPLFLAAVAIAADPARDQSSADPRLLTEIGREVRDVLRAESRAETPAERSEAVHRMAGLYREILADPRLAQSETLKAHKARLWSRMTHIQQDLERRQRREARLSQTDPDAEQLAAVEQATRALADEMTLMNYALGGPAYAFQHSGGALGGRAVNDHGQELIELIQRTIRPDFWDTAGGPGSMFYYQPLMALVVRATSEVHGNVGGLLGALRRAGQ